ncbi:MAG: stalk domain-containing protein [Zhaonellaceae bacterium]
MKIMGKKWMYLVTLALIIALTFGLTGTAFGAQVVKVIKVYANGKLLNLTDVPIMHKDRVYVPVRAMSEILGKNVDWDSAAYAVRVTDKPDAATDAKVKELENTITQLKNQLAEKDMQYLILQAQYEALLEEGKTMSLKDMQKQLNKEYDEYRDVEFDITLSGKESDITVEIAVDLDDFEDEWDDLSDNNKTKYLQGIVDDLLEEYEDAEIEGYIYDSSTKSKPKLATFTVSSKGKVQLKSAASLSDLEDDLDDEYYDYFSGITLAVELDGDPDEIEYFVYVNLRTYDQSGELCLIVV